MANRTKLTAKKGEKLLGKLALGYSITAACKAEGISRQSYYDWREADTEFVNAADDAIEAGIDRLEDEAYRRAISPLGSDTMTIFLLKSKRRSVYGDKQQLEHTGANGAPLVITIGQREDGPQ